MQPTAQAVFKLIFGLIIGGAAGNLIDRVIHDGYVVDFIFFRIPQIGYHFAIFNIADASISIGVVLLFLFILLGGLRKSGNATNKQEAVNDTVRSTLPQIEQSDSLHRTEQDVQS